MHNIPIAYPLISRNIDVTTNEMCQMVIENYRWNTSNSHLNFMKKSHPVKGRFKKKNTKHVLPDSWPHSAHAGPSKPKPKVTNHNNRCRESNDRNN